MTRDDASSFEIGREVPKRFEVEDKVEVEGNFMI